jgi:predicted SAM-dependent methyltransferase
MSRLESLPYILRNKLFAKTKNPKFLNIGAGHWFCFGWTRLDFNNNRTKYQFHPSFIDINFDLTQNEPFPIKDDSIICCYCSHVFEHLPNYAVEHTIKEVLRVLRYKGIFRINQMNPECERFNNSNMEYEYENNSNHINSWDKDRLKRLLFNCGFNIVYESKPYNSLSPYMRSYKFDKLEEQSYRLECIKRIKEEHQ